MYTEYYSIFFIILLILLFWIFYFSPSRFNQNVTEKFENCYDLTEVGCVYLKLCNKYLSFTSTENYSHVFITGGTLKTDGSPSNVKNYYNKVGDKNAYSYSLDINLEEPQRWILEAAPENSLYIRTLEKPYFYLGCDCNGKVFTTLIKGSSNQWWTFTSVSSDKFTIQSTIHKNYLHSLYQGGYLFTKRRGKVFSSKNVNPVHWQVVPCIQSGNVPTN